MKNNLFVVFLMIFCNAVFGQTTNFKPHLAILEGNDGEIARGILYKTTDSSIFLLPKSAISIDTNMLQQYKIKYVKRIRIRKKSSVLTGFLIGGGVGAVAAVILQATKNSQTGFGASLQNAIITVAQIAYVTEVPAIGGLIGTHTKKYIIKNDVSNFKIYQPAINSFALKRN